MKKSSFLIILFVFCGICSAAQIPRYSQPQFMSTYISPYDMVINSVDSNDTPLDANSCYWDSIKPENGVFKKIDPRWNWMEIAFVVVSDDTDSNYCDDPDGAYFNFRLFAARWYGNAVVVYDGNAVCGNMELSRDPDGSNIYNDGIPDPNQRAKWVDTINADSNSDGGDCWSSSSSFPILHKTDNAKTVNGIGRIWWKTNGYGITWCEFTRLEADKPKRIMCVATGY